MRAVIRFECNDITTCLDGYAHPPAYEECVALGPVTADSIRLDYDTAGPGSKKVVVSITTPSASLSYQISINEVFLWVRKARQYLNVCRSYMVFADEPRPLRCGFFPVPALAAAAVTPSALSSS